jgi:hypothetical protein
MRIKYKKCLEIDIKQQYQTSQNCDKDKNDKRFQNKNYQYDEV